MDVNKVRNYLIFLVYIDSMTTINNETRMLIIYDC